MPAPADAPPAGMKIVNGHLARDLRTQGLLRAPNGYGYIHLAAEVERPRPFRRNGAAKEALLGRLREAGDRLREAHGGPIRRIDLFDAFFLPPGAETGRRIIEKKGLDAHVAAFDVVVTVECADVAAARTVRASPEFAELEAMLKAAAGHTHCVVARNVRRIDEVDRDRDGVFLFNYFIAADPALASPVWEYTAGWWTAKANLTNSTPLEPVAGETSDYALINHCRWDRLIDVLPHLVLRPSLRRFVLANFTANGLVSRPILYRLANRRDGAATGAGP